MSKKLKNFPIPGQAYKLCLIKNVLHTVIEDDNHHNEKNYKGRKASCKGTKKIQSKNNDIGVKMIRSNCSFSIVTPVIMAFKKTRSIDLLPTRHTPYQQKHTYTESKGWKKKFHANGKKKRADLFIIVSNKIKFIMKGVKRDKEGHCMIKGLIQPEEITISNVYVLNAGTHGYLKQLLLTLKGYLDSNTVITGISTPHFHQHSR